MVEYYDESGACHRYRVREVIHTLQTSAAHRPAVDRHGPALASVLRAVQLPSGDSGRAVTLIEHRYLPAPEQDVLTLRVWEGLGYDEIAVALGAAVAAPSSFAENEAEPTTTAAQAQTNPMPPRYPVSTAIRSETTRARPST
mgnify:CR=1 FL=1